MQCPVCQQPMWDNRAKKKNPKGPDYRCKDETCMFSLNPDTGEYEPGEYQTAVWLKKELDTQEKQFQESVKPKESIKPKDDFIEGKERNTTLMCRKDLMVAIIHKLGETTTTGEIKNAFNDLWNEVVK